MINSYTNTTQTVAANELLSFAEDRVKTGCTVVHTPGSTTFALKRPGFYFVTLNADVTTSETAGNVVLTLQNNGTAIPGAVATSYAAAAVNVGNVAFSAIIQVQPSCCAVSNTTNLTVANTGVGATISNVSLVITKLA